MTLTVDSCTSGANCIPVGVNPLQTTCGFTRPVTTDSSGQIISGGQIDLHSNWTSFSSSELRRTFIHEIGHHLGLGDYPPDSQCTANAAAMNDTYTCGGGSVMDSVTFNDHQPVKKTAYGSTPRTTCGF